MVHLKLSSNSYPASVASLILMVMLMFLSTGCQSTSSNKPVLSTSSGGDEKEKTDLQIAIAVPAAYTFEEPNGAIYSQYIYGSVHAVTQTQADWYEIEQDEHSVWIHRRDVVEVSSALATELAQSELVILALEGHVFAEPSMIKAPPILSLPYGTQLMELSESLVEQELEAVREQDEEAINLRPDRYAAVRLVDGGIGFVRRGDVGDALPVLRQEELAELAHQFMGRPYTWGGASAIGFDCSGFTLSLARHRGLELPHHAGHQFTHPKLDAIEKQALTPGDLLYFSSSGSTSDRITHCGMYIGEGQFIHASAKNRPSVQLGNLGDDDWVKRFRGARRLP